jgi:hypothetical protein
LERLRDRGVVFDQQQAHVVRLARRRVVWVRAYRTFAFPWPPPGHPLRSVGPEVT